MENPNSQGRTKIKKVLAVDDDQLFLEFMDDLLSKEGYEVLTAEDGLSALDILKTHTPDIIFIDLIMPRIEGKVLCRIIRSMEEFNDAYVIILSGTLAEEKIDLSLLGADACIAKGPLSEMSQHILEVLANPELASSRSRSGEVIGIESVSARGMTTELLAFKDHFNAVLRQMAQGFLEVTSEGWIVYANPAALSLIGIPEEELLGSDYIKLFAQRDHARLYGLLKKPDDNPPITYDSPVRLNEHEVTLDILPFAGNKDTFSIAITDVTRLRREAEALSAGERRLRKLINENVDAIVIVDGEGSVKFLNLAAERLFGRRSEEMIGDPFGFPLTAGETTELDLFGGGGEPSVGEMRVVEIEWEGDKAFLASIRDITQRKRMEENLRKANEKILEQQDELIEEERLKVLLQMAGATAHEMNQPLNVLLGNIELLEYDKDNPEKLGHRLDAIKTAGKKISSTVKKIQNVRHVNTKPYAGGRTIIDIDQKTNVLSVETSDKDFETISAVIGEMEAMNLIRAKGIDEAMELLDQNNIDIVLSAYRLPDGNGGDLLEALAEKEIETPVVILTAYGDDMIASELIQAGAYDYLTKNRLSKKSISQSINSAVEKARLKREIRMVQDKMAEMATLDELTGLYNRRYFEDAFNRDFARAKRHGPELVLSMMDLDHFKEINDTYGHSAGDMVLSETGKIIRRWARQTDICCRYGGEEFAAIMPDTGSGGARTACERLRKMMGEHPFEYEASQFQVTISIGVAEYSGSKDQSPGDLVKRADEALYRAKNEGRNRVVGF